MKNYYEILNVNRKTSQNDIKLAYRNLAKKYHPDNNSGNHDAEIIFKDLNEAYSILSNIDEKRKYDKKSARYRYGMENGNFNDVTYEVKKTKNALNDFMCNFLGIIKDSKKTLNISDDTNTPIKGENDETEIKITLEEAFFGGEKKIVIKGYESDNSNKTLKVDIPKGIKDGHKIRLAGCGKVGKNGGKNGDLIITVKVLEHKEYVLDGIDIIKNIFITPAQAALGCILSTETIDGEVDIKIPECTQTDKKIKIPNKGFRLSEKRRGDLILNIKIQIPKELTTKQKELYLKLRECED